MRFINACGGGGGHVTAGAMGQNHPGFNAAGGFGGGTVGTSTSVLDLYCGGGGGGGGLDVDAGLNSRGGNGGGGGGVVFLLANIIELNGDIRADGGNGLDGVYFGPASPGGGGGGGGGSIFVSAATVTAALGQFTANGGTGGRGSEAGGGNYRGGTGGLGRIILDVEGAAVGEQLCP